VTLGLGRSIGGIGACVDVRLWATSLAVTFSKTLSYFCHSRVDQCWGLCAARWGSGVHEVEQANSE
jgi:hypothetical protein